MAQEVLRETASTNESSRGLISQEFFFLLQRMDRLDEKFSAEVKRMDDKFSSEIRRLEGKLDRKLGNLFWATLGVIVTLAAGLGGVIITLLHR